jgi:hypothetical protein
VGTVGSVGGGAALVSAAIRPARDATMPHELAAGFVPSPGSVIMTAGLTVAERDSATDILPNATWCGAGLKVFCQKARVACTLIRVRDTPRFTG